MENEKFHAIVEEIRDLIARARRIIDSSRLRTKPETFCHISDMLGALDSDDKRQVFVAVLMAKHSATLAKPWHPASFKDVPAGFFPGFLGALSAAFPASLSPSRRRTRGVHGRHEGQRTAGERCTCGSTGCASGSEE